MTAPCGVADSGLGPSTANGNSGRLNPSTNCGLPSVDEQPAAPNGNAGSVIPPSTTAPGGSLVTPPLPQPQVTAVVLQQTGIATIVLVGE